MPKHLTKYNPSWELEFSWIQSCNQDIYSAKCKLCSKKKNCTFRIDSGGKSQLISHANSKKHKGAAAIISGETNQATFQVSASGDALLAKGWLKLI